MNEKLKWVISAAITLSILTASMYGIITDSKYFILGCIAVIALTVIVGFTVVVKRTLFY